MMTTASTMMAVFTTPLLTSILVRAGHGSQGLLYEQHCYKPARHNTDQQISSTTVVRLAPMAVYSVSCVSVLHAGWHACAC